MKITDRKPRERKERGTTEMINTGCGHLYITINTKDEAIFEVFVRLGKSGQCAAGLMSALTYSITSGLRYGVPVEEYIDRLKDIKCPGPAWDQGAQIQSCADAISKALKKAQDKINTRKELKEL